MWLYFYSYDNPETSTKSDTVFYTSVKAPAGACVDLYCGKSLLERMKAAGNCFIKLEYQGKIQYADSISIKISGLSERDTVSFLSVNLFKNNEVSTLPENQFQLVMADSAVQCRNNINMLSYCPIKNSHQIITRFNNPSQWLKPGISRFKTWIIFLTFLITIIALLYFSPRSSYLYFITIFTTIILTFYWWIGKDTGALLTLKNDISLKEVVFYHNSIPVFLPLPHEFFKGPNKEFSTDVDFAKDSYYRISINKSTESINNMSFKFSYGLIGRSCDIRSLKPCEIIVNDINYNSRNSTWSVSGNDPYISLITSPIITTNLKLIFLRKSFFLFISAFIFIILLFLNPLLGLIPIHKRILVLLFFTILFNTLSFWVFNSRKHVLDSEKRLAYSAPDFDSLSFKEYGRRVSLYIQDQIPGRNNLITSNNFIKYELFGEVPGNSMVYFGKDNWMFYTGENVREIYENKHPLTDEELLTMKNVLVGRRDWLRKRNIHYYIIFPRLPHFMYNEKIGSGLNVYNAKPKLIQLLEYLKQNTDLDIIDVEKPILEAKVRYKPNMYYHNDSHWTLFGSYFAYCEIINHIRKDFPNMPPPIPFDDITWIEMEDNDADLAQLLCLNTVIHRHEYIPLNHRVKAFKMLATPNYPEFQSIHPMLLFSSNYAKAPKLVMNRDSYSNFLIPYFATNFSRQCYLWSPFFYPGIIEKEKPDIVITEMLERFIYDLLKDTSIPKDSIVTSVYQGNAE